MDYKKEIHNIERFIAEAQYRQAGITMGTLLESALYEFYTKVRARANAGDIRNIVEAEQSIGKGKLVEEFSLGQLVGLYRNARIFSLIEHYLKIELKRAPKIPLNDLNEIRNRCVHQRIEDRKISLDEIEYVNTNLKYLLMDFGLIDSKTINLREERSNKKSSELTECTTCGTKIKKDWLLCPKCGEKLAQACAGCGVRMDPNWKLCPICGTSINTEKENKGKRKKEKSKKFKNYQDKLIDSIFQGSFSSNIPEIEEIAKHTREKIVSNKGEFTISIFEAVINWSWKEACSLADFAASGIHESNSDQIIKQVLERLDSLLMQMEIAEEKHRVFLFETDESDIPEKDRNIMDSERNIYYSSSRSFKKMYSDVKFIKKQVMKGKW